jgi:hypothetical protein
MFDGGGVGDWAGGAEMIGVGVGNQPSAGCLVEPLAETTVRESELLHAAPIAMVTATAGIHFQRIRILEG